MKLLQIIFGKSVAYLQIQRQSRSRFTSYLSFWLNMNPVLILLQRLTMKNKGKKTKRTSPLAKQYSTATRKPWEVRVKVVVNVNLEQNY